MKNDIEIIIEDTYKIEYESNSNVELYKTLQKLDTYINKNHFLRSNNYKKEIEAIKLTIEELSSFTSSEDRLLFRKIQKQIVTLLRTVHEENKKIFIVHGRNISMRDKVSALLGRLKLDYAILEYEHNSGATIIEKFLKTAETCDYAVVLFSADDLGQLVGDQTILRNRVRQNVVLELGYFLSKVGRKNIVILHETDKDIEFPSDFSGIVYEPFDSYGAWKGKLIKEMRNAKIYIDQNLAEKV